MKKVFLLALFSATSVVAGADTYVCTNDDGDFRVRIREEETMVLSNPTIRGNRKTIAVFSEDQENLTIDGNSYVGDVDLRKIGTDRAGERLLGTRLGEVDTVEVRLYPTIEKARVWLDKRDGNSVSELLNCAE